jgi:chromosomal replication initiator protein
MSVGRAHNAMQSSPLTLARFVTTPENRAAVRGVQDMVESLATRRASRRHNPLFLHGPAGSGKTHLVTALVEEATRRRPDLIVNIVAARDIAHGLSGNGDEDGESQERGEKALPRVTRYPAASCDLLVIEDLQQLPLRAAESLVHRIDTLLARGRQVVVTANVGPQQLEQRGRPYPARLTSRLAAGLVVYLPTLSAAGRRALLEQEARRRKLRMAPEVLAWLAERLPGSARQLLGALGRLEVQARQRGRSIELTEVASLLKEQAQPSEVTVEQIAGRVGGYFQVAPALLQSRARSRGVLWPRQIGMYLARQLTSLSLEQIGAYFGGRDHSTVLHACRKVEAALTADAGLSGAVRRLHADLT